MGLELATMASRRSAQDQAIRYLKRYAPDYLYMRIDSAPDEFWKLAFPMPYREDLERFARQNNLDPFLVAALARQESEFNPKAVSVVQRARAHADHALHRPRVEPPLAHQALFDGATVPAAGEFAVGHVSICNRSPIASKAAGKRRWRPTTPDSAARRTWSTWGEFREAAEFVETVPFTQTREYIQIVLRNADIYRQLYASAKPALPSCLPKAAAPASRVSYSNGIDQRSKSSRATGAR